MSPIARESAWLPRPWTGGGWPIRTGASDVLGCGRSSRMKAASGAIMTIAPGSLSLSAVTSATLRPPVMTGVATISPVVDGDHASA
jgi:hypothetical protein